MVGDRKKVSSYEEKVLKFFGPLGEYQYKKKKNKHKLITIGEILQYAGINTSKYGYDEIMNKEFSQICRVGSRFVKNCICVQFEEDSDELMDWAISHGALLLVTRVQIKDFPCLVVEKTEEVYSKMCQYFRRNSDVEITAVVGSIGKTTTKRMISAVYNEQFNTFNDPENENQIDCVGYACQHIPKKTEKQVQEVSEDTKGCVKLISNIIEPRIAVITSIDTSHIENFGTKEAISKEILSIEDGMPSDGVVILNYDDEILHEISINHKKITVSLENPSADFYSKEIKIDKDGMKFIVVDNINQKEYKLCLKQTYAKHNIYSAIYSLVCGLICKVDISQIKKALKNYHTVGIRQNIYKANKDVLLYVDCYNATAKSVKSAVSASDIIPVKGKRIAVLGDIEETGSLSNQIHEEIISIIDDSNFDILYCYGEKLSSAIKSMNYRDDLIVKSTMSKVELSSWIKKNTQKGDLLLFKASRKSELETVIKKVFPISYYRNMVYYYIPIIVWRLKIVTN